MIGVGESTTPNLPYHLFEYLDISPKLFYATGGADVEDGDSFYWGPRGSFDYSFEPQLDVRVPELPRPNGYYCDDDFSNMCLQTALMAHEKAFRDAGKWRRAGDSQLARVSPR